MFKLNVIKSVCTKIENLWRVIDSGKFDVPVWLMITCPGTKQSQPHVSPCFSWWCCIFSFPIGLCATHVLCWLEKTSLVWWLLIYFYSLPRVLNTDLKLVRLWAASRYSVATVVTYLYIFCKHLLLFHRRIFLLRFFHNSM